MIDLVGIMNGVDAIIWAIPGTISDYLGSRMDSAKNDFSRGVYGAVKGVIDGTVKLHHVTAVLNHELPQSDFDKERMDKFRASENKVERYARRLTMLAETAGYGYLASQLNPWALAPAVYNIADMFVEDRREDEARGYEIPLGTPPEINPKWIENEFSLLDI